jgi:hypothetical protein
MRIPPHSLTEDTKMNPVDRKEAAKMTSSDIKRARAFEEMCRTEGWKEYTILMNSWINQRMNDLLGPTPDNGHGRAEHIKGTVYGIMMCRDTPGVNIATMKEMMAAGTPGANPVDKE